MRGLATFGGGAIFGGGLALSGMTMPEIVLDFLLLRDLGLLLVMGGGVAVGLVAFAAVRRPWLGGEREPYRTSLSARTVAGSVVFGVGWGVSGVCPGAAVAGLGTGNLPLAIAVAAMLLGAWAQDRLLPAPAPSGDD